MNELEAIRNFIDDCGWAIMDEAQVGEFYRFGISQTKIFDGWGPNNYMDRTKGGWYVMYVSPDGKIILSVGGGLGDNDVFEVLLSDPECFDKLKAKLQE